LHIAELVQRGSMQDYFGFSRKKSHQFCNGNLVLVTDCTFKIAPNLIWIDFKLQL